MKTLVLCPRAEEFEIVRQEFQRSWITSTPGTQLFYPSEEFSESDVLLGIGGQGKVNFALHTLHALERYPSLECIIGVGAAGALDPAIQLQSVVVASSIFEHDFKSHFQRKLGVSHKLDTSLFDTLSTQEKNREFDLHFGSVASGDEDIFDPESKNELIERSKSLAVAWEGAGGARASRFHKKRYFEVRGITDRADKFDLENYQRTFPEALRNAAQVAKTLVSLFK